MSKTYIPVATIEQVRERAKNCCEYCLMPEIATFASHEVDHIIAKKHGGLTQAENLALSCTLCNKYKRSHIDRSRNRGYCPTLPSSSRFMA